MTDLIDRVAEALHDTGELPPFTVEHVARAAAVATLEALAAEATRLGGGKEFAAVEYLDAEFVRHIQPLDDWLRERAKEVAGGQ